jgi:hypothetical protein
MKHIQPLFEFDQFFESVSTEKLDKLFQHLKTKSFDSDWVEDLINDLDTVEHRKLEKSYLTHGVMSLSSLRLLKTFCRHIVNESLIDEIIKATKKTYKSMEESWELHKSGYNQYTPQQIELTKDALKDKDEILRRLDQMKRRMAKYQEEL